MNIAFLVIGHDMPSTRFRVLQFLPFLGERGASFRVFEPERSPAFPFPKKLWRLFQYLRIPWVVRRYDLVFLQKPGFIANRWLSLRWLFRLNRKVVFDFDDAVFLNPDTGGAAGHAVLARLEFILRRSSAVIAGNSYLADFAKRYNPRVEIVPTSVDSDRYRPRVGPPPARPVAIGWIGTRPNLAYLFRLAPVMKRVLARTAAEFLVITNLERRPAELDLGARLRFRMWRAGTEVEDMQRLDIGIMPLDDTPFTRGKCGFKLLQYMALGIPVVASPVGVNRSIVEDGVNGFLAADLEEWSEKLELLCRDAALRQRMGAAGREKVVREYSLRRWAGTWVDVLKREAAGDDR